MTDVIKTFKESELIFITTGAYSDKNYFLFRCLKDFTESDIKQEFCYLAKHELGEGFNSWVDDIDHIAWLEKRGYVEQITVQKLINYSYGDEPCFETTEYEQDELIKSREKHKSQPLIRKVES